MVHLGYVRVIHLEMYCAFFLCIVDGESGLCNLLFFNGLDDNVSVLLEMLGLGQVDHCGLLPADQLTWLTWFVHGID